MDCCCDCDDKISRLTEDMVDQPSAGQRSSRRVALLCR